MVGTGVRSCGADVRGAAAFHTSGVPLQGGRQWRGGTSGTCCLLPLLTQIDEMWTKSGAGACFGAGGTTAMGGQLAPST